jgi:hypothetical protein
LQNTNDTTYFAADKLHLVNAGYAVVATEVDAAIARLDVPAAIASDVSIGTGIGIGID